MTLNLRKALLAGTAIVAVGGFAAGANAQTAVTADTTFDDGTSGTNVSTLTLTDAPVMTINNAAVTIDADITAGGANNGVVGFVTAGESSLTINAGRTVTSAGTGDAVTTADLADVSVTVSGTLAASANTEDAINFSSLGASNGGTILINGGAGTDGNVTGLITGGAGADSLTINTALGDSIIDGVVDMGGETDTITISGSNTANFTAAVTAETVAVGAGSTLDADDTITGNVTVTTSSIVELAASANISGTVDNVSGSNNAGELILEGASTIGGNVGETNSLSVVAIGNGTGTFSGTVNANTIDFDNDAGVAAFAQSVTASTLSFDGYTGTVTLADDANFTGNIDNALMTGGTSGAATTAGTLTFTGTSTVSGRVGGTNELAVINAGAAGEEVTFSGAVDAATINLTGTGTVDFDGAVDATLLDFDNNAGTVELGVSSTITTIDFGDAAGTLDIADNVNLTGDIRDTNDDEGTVNFAGSSTVTGNVGVAADGVALVNFNGGTGETVSVSGTIVATDIKVAGAGTVDANGNITGAVDYDAAGTLVLANNVTVTGAVGVSTADQGVLTFEGAGGISSTLNAGGFELNTLNLNGDDATVTVGGATVAAKTNNIGNNTLDITGTFATDAGDTLNFTVDGATTAGQVASSSTATIHTDTNVNITVDTTAFVANNQAFTLVDGTGGGAVADLSAGRITDNSVLLSFAQDTSDDDNLVVTATRASVTSVTSNANTIALSNMLTANSGSLGAVQGYFQSATSAADLEKRAEAISPTVDGAAFVAGAQAGSQSFSTTNSRIQVARGATEDTGMVAGEMGEGVGVWGKAFGQMAEQDERDGISGYDADTFGLAVGMDTDRIMNDGLVGISFSYANTDVESDNLTTTDTDVDSYQFTVYGSKNLDDAMYVSGMVGYARNNVDQTRNNVLGSDQTANADYDGNQYMAYAEFGRDYDRGDMVVTPRALVNYVHSDYDGYTETGTSGGNLSVGSSDTDVLELGLGVTAEWEIMQDNGGVFKPSVTAEYRYDLIGDEVQTTSSFTGGGAAFETEGFDPAQSSFLIGAGFDYELDNAVTISADYGYQFKEDYDAHNLSVRAGMKF